MFARTVKLKGAAVAASVALALYAASFSALAAINIDVSGANPNTYASQLIVPANGLQITLVDNQASVSLGKSYPANTRITVRFDLGNMARFVSAPSAMLSGTTGEILFGGAGQNFVIFGFTRGPITSANATVLLTINGVNVRNDQSVPISYELFDAEADAVNRLNPVKSRSAMLLGFISALEVVSTGVLDRVADVQAAGGPYTAFVDGSTLESLLSYRLVHRPQARLANGAQSTIDTFAGGLSVLSVSGSRRFLDLQLIARGSLAGADCTQNPVPSEPVGVIQPDQGFIAKLTPAQLQTGVVLCGRATALGTLLASRYFAVGSFLPPPPQQATVKATRLVSDLASITRNGLSLKAPFFQGGGNIRTTAKFTNTSFAQPAVYTVRCFTSTDDEVAGSGGVIAPGASIERTAGGLCPGLSSLTAAEFIFAALPGDVIGSVQRQNLSVGSISTESMIGSQ